MERKAGPFDAHVKPARRNERMRLWQVYELRRESLSARMIAQRLGGNQDIVDRRIQRWLTLGYIEPDVEMQEKHGALGAVLPEDTRWYRLSSHHRVTDAPLVAHRLHQIMHAMVRAAYSHDNDRSDRSNANAVAG